MKKYFLYCAIILAAITACKKEYSMENGGNVNNPLIVGANCRISKIVSYDSATGLPLVSIAANINTLDNVTDITQFDSIGNTIIFYTPISYTPPDTILLNADEYFVTDPFSGGRISKLHGLTNPADPTSPQFDADYAYDAAGHLVSKIYAFTGSPAFPYYEVDYTYSAGNLTHMTGTDVFSADLVVDADIGYNPMFVPKNFLYLFPDELTYSYANQFFNFGKRSTNALQNLKVRYYDPGNVLRDSTVSSFNTYIMSRDNYVLSVNMTGNDQFSIPARVGKQIFSYSCKP